jgi:hypothetical protein
VSTVRDGLDVVTSTVPDHPKKYNEYWCSIQRYVDSMSAIYGFPSERHRIVFYEDLVRDPAGQMEDLTSWLGVPYDPAIITSFLHQAPTRNADASHQSKLSGPIDSRQIGRWRDPRHQHRVADFLNSQEAVHWREIAGYPRIAPSY